MRPALLPRLVPALLALVALAALGAAPALAGPGLRAGGSAPAPDAPGPFAVGHRSFVAVDASRDGREIPIDVWYPVNPAEAEGPAAVYPVLEPNLLPGLPGVPLASERAVADAPVSAAGPFPLVVFSHGSGGVRFQSFFLNEQLASHGFVVAAPDHPGNTALDAFAGTQDPFPVIALDRPADVAFVIDVLLERSGEPGDALAGSADGERVGVTGHSFGGFTALAAASGYANFQGAVPPDPRVDAIAPLAPASSILSDAALERIELPTLLVGGTEDETTPVVPEVSRPFAEIPARPRHRADVRDAGHTSFTNICSFETAVRASALPGFVKRILLLALESDIEAGCAPELLPIGEVHRVTELYSVAFFRRFLAGDTRYERYLTEGRARSRGLPVDYFEVSGGAPPLR